MVLAHGQGEGGCWYGMYKVAIFIFKICLAAHFIMKLNVINGGWRM